MMENLHQKKLSRSRIGFKLKYFIQVANNRKLENDELRMMNDK